MTDTTMFQEDAALEWLFSKAREFPLLTAEEEQTIDQRKWAARSELLRLFLHDDRCRTYLHLWVRNLLDNPPSLETFSAREHYYLLRREQSPLQQSPEKTTLLEELAETLSEVEIPARGDEQALPLLEELELSAVLVAGMAARLTAATGAGDMAAALSYWEQFWPGRELRAWCALSTPAAHLQSVARELDAYQASREQLVNHNLRLVFSVAGKLQSQQVPFQDRVQSGVMGLIRAAEKFDHRRGYRFSTYAYSWINQAARRTLDEQRGIVRYPSDIGEQVSRLYRERMHYLNATGREPGTQVLAERMSMKPEALGRLQQVGNWSLSLDSTPDGDTEGLTLAETLPGWTYSPPAAEAEQTSLNRCLMRSLKTLTPQEQRVITLRWGLEQSPPLTRREMADHMQVSSERVRQLELSALDKLRTDREVLSAYRDYETTD